ncbi:MAG: MerR family transcriptional regulator [Acidobacteriota bacterium]
MPPKARVQKRLYYKIGEACKALDIQPYVLRYWETEFPALSPSKSRSGQRVYSEKELAIIRRIKELLYGEGYTIAGAKKRLETELENGTLDEDGTPSLIETAGAAEPAVAGIAEAPAADLPLRPAKRAAKATAAPAVSASFADLSFDPELDLPLLPDPPEIPVLSLDTQGTERIQTLRSGIRQALGQAREILALLESSSP